jgi:hypothetical protein
MNRSKPWHSKLASTAFALTLLAVTAQAAQPEDTNPIQNTSLIQKMAANEAAARQQRPNFYYVAEERSDRTSGHLWKEIVVETPDGALRRLVAIDNRPVTADEASAEQRRIDYIVAHPEDFRKLNQTNKDDEGRATQLLQLLSTAFDLQADGDANGCTRFNFQPKPGFQPSSYQERVAHEMTGTISVKQPEDRLCTLDATIAHPVEFGFGMLGHIDQGGHFSLERKEVDPQNWKSDRISVHVTGRILMLKSLTQSKDVIRSEIRAVPQNLTLAQAAQISHQQ